MHASVLREHTTGKPTCLYLYVYCIVQAISLEIYQSTREAIVHKHKSN